MKKLLPFYLLCSFFISAEGQSIQRRINFTPRDKDSLDLALNADYNLIEDSCATITRHVRLNFDTKKFHGRFTDIRKDNPAVTLTEGNYNVDGQKEGTFILRYTSGNIKAKGNFKSDVFDGKWEVYYDDGKPELTFEAYNGIYTMTDAWDDKGSKFVDKGSGTYSVEATPFIWQGKLVNGRPDGAWKMYRGTDPWKNTRGTEHFKKGEFVKGENQIGAYTDASRIVLVSNELFPFINAEKLLLGLPCNMASLQPKVVNAHYKGGMASFKFHIQDELSRYLNHIGFEGLEGSFYITGDIDITGHIINLKKGGGYIANIEQGVIKMIESLPQVIPATIDGKPIVQQFKISLVVNNTGYSGSFEFLPIRY